MCRRGREIDTHQIPPRQRRHRADRPSNYCGDRCSHPTSWAYFREHATACTGCGVRSLHNDGDRLCPPCATDALRAEFFGGPHTKQQAIDELRRMTREVAAFRRAHGGP